MSGDAPTLKDLPKIEGNLKDAISQKHDLKNVGGVEEKNVLPTAEDLKQEKVHESIIKGVEGFTPDKLKHAKTREPASGADVMKSEMAHGNTVKAVSEFDKTNLKKAETQEKNPLPDNEAIKQEAEHQKFKDGIEKFNTGKLEHVETVEKNTLPTKEIIDQEKKA